MNSILYRVDEPMGTSDPSPEPREPSQSQELEWVTWPNPLYGGFWGKTDKEMENEKGGRVKWYLSRV